GTGFVPSTPYQLYYADVGPATQWLANPALKPQRSLTWDLGARRKFGAGTEAGVTVFHTLWRDKIGAMIVDYGIPLKRQSQNIGQAESRGAEIEFSHKAGGGWSAFFNYTHTRTRVTENLANPALAGKELPDMPRHKFNLGVGYENGGMTGKGLLRYVGASYTDENNTVTDGKGYRWQREPYHVVDLSLTKRFRDVDLTLAADNLFDRKYQSGFFWRAEGRIVRAEAAFRF
ncbi:MAG: TonB-dependent receptor, partial [Sulfuricella sp.]|nr:TonB-dependent receptor [Sulfuricella sp.]